MKKRKEGNDESLEDLLQNRAKRLVRSSAMRNWDSAPSDIVRREVALTLDHIKRVTTLDDELEYKKLKIESYIGTQFIRMKYNRLPNYEQIKYQLHRQLQELELERWKHTVRKEEQLQGLREKLMSLMNKHGQLDF